LPDALPIPQLRSGSALPSGASSSRERPTVPPVYRPARSTPVQAKLAIQPSPAAAALHRAAAHIARSVVQLAARRASTLSKTKMSMAKARAGAVPYARSRRESVSYKNVEAHEDYGSFLRLYQAKD